MDVVIRPVKRATGIGRRTRFIWFAAAFAVSGISSAFSSDLAEQKASLLQKLDSLDMEKQSRKRQGQSIDDLEKVSAIVKDSIAAIRKGLGGATEQARPLPKQNALETMPSFLKDYAKYIPHNTFDWIVVAVGFAAVIAGAILCIALIGMLFKKRPRTLPLPREPREKKIPLKPLHEIFPNDAFDGAEVSPSAPAGQADSLSEAIDVVRKKINRGNTDTVQNRIPLETEPDLSPENVTATPDLKSRVIAAARRGEDVRAISKKFHIGVDEVSLMLRVARQESDAGL
jgi:hypothetical protein